MAGGPRLQTQITVVTSVTTEGQPSESLTTGFRDNKENGKQINWEPMKRESMWGASLKGGGREQTTKQTGGWGERKMRHEHRAYPVKMSALCKASLLVFLQKSETSALGHHQSNRRWSMPSAKEKVEMLGSSGTTFETILLMRPFWVNLDYECQNHCNWTHDNSLFSFDYTVKIRLTIMSQLHKQGLFPFVHTKILSVVVSRWTSIVSIQNCWELVVESYRGCEIDGAKWGKYTLKRA